MDNDKQLALIGSQSASSGFSTLCSPGLRKLLTEGEDGRSAIRLIAINKTLRAEVERQLPAIEAARAPAQPEELLATLIRHAPHFGVQAKSGAEWASLFGVYLDALEGLPAAAVEDAFLRWNRGEPYGLASGRHSFYPKSAEVYQLAELSRRELFMASYRAKRALEYVEKEGLEWTPQRKAQEREKMIEMGLLNPDGSPNMGDAKPKSMHELVVRPKLSPQEMAEQIRRAAAPPVDDVGDVV